MGLEVRAGKGSLGRQPGAVHTLDLLLQVMGSHGEYRSDEVMGPDLLF